ncbi:dephospho-CoA kinase [Candidatus Pandoraea novymonadis]|uniref:dephospho-CoA kinase n=1 Tax=Candidatus Pandoraea novymonadis TaxID=1808959 RepID=UPI000D06F162|nr:dephospho-CoA kinase [Candidatus Pandoraea novymonadis]
MYRIGLTGGIGSGKTTVANLFARHGVPIIDTDSIAHEITSSHGAAMTSIRTTFGSNFIAPDGSLDRNRMRALVFKDKKAKAALEAITHPLIRAKCEQASSKSNEPYLIFVVPLLIESKAWWRPRIQRIVIIDCEEETQIARVMARNNFTREQVLSIIARQAGRAERRASADDIIDNNDRAPPITLQVKCLHKRYLSLAKKTAKEISWQ